MSNIELIIRLFLSVLFGGIIGMERKSVNVEKIAFFKQMNRKENADV